MKISQDVLTVLSTMEIDGLVARFAAGPQLERKLYERTNAVLVELGGKWARSKKGHVFATDPSARFDQAILSGDVSTAKEAGFFPTPIALAKRLVEMADIKPGMRVLEPSAGTGRIVTAILRSAPDVALYCVERDMDRAESLKSVTSGPIESGDFLSIDPQNPQNGLGYFDRVVANPPFARQQDIDHVLHAFEFLRPGGRLVSVMSAGVVFRQDQKAKAFREFITGRGSIESLPDDSFKESGTNVRAAIVTLYKSISVKNVIATAGR